MSVNNIRVQFAFRASDKLICLFIPLAEHEKVTDAQESWKEDPLSHMHKDSVLCFVPLITAFFILTAGGHCAVVSQLHSRACANKRVIFPAQ